MILIEENASESVFCKISAIFFQPHSVKAGSLQFLKGKN